MVGSSDDIIDRMVDLIVRSIDPDLIILFGSRARGDIDENSDIDLLIVKDGVSGQRELLRSVYDSMSGITTPVDMILVDGKKMRQYIDDPYMIYGTAMKEGRTLYAKT